MNKEALINKYFLDELSNEELEQLDALLKRDEDFKEQFEFEKKARKVIRHKQQTIAKSKLQGFEEELKTSPKRTTTSFFSKPWRIAASIAIIISVGTYIWMSNATVDTQKLYASNYEVYPNTVFSITRGSQEQDVIEFKAFEAYEIQDYTKAIPLLIELKNQRNPKYVDFYLGQAYLNDNDLEKAISSFKNAIIENRAFITEAKWYLALAYLKNEDKENATIQLREVISTGRYKQKEAKALLEKLE